MVQLEGSVSPTVYKYVILRYFSYRVSIEWTLLSSKILRSKRIKTISGFVFDYNVRSPQHFDLGNYELNVLTFRRKALRRLYLQRQTVQTS